LCDIVEMDACHVILERPWLFDINVSHDERNNTYEFLKDGQRYILELMVETKISENDRKGSDNINVCSSSHIMTCSAKEFLREKKNVHFCFTLMPR
jgi:hypothetical protein